MMRPLCGKHGAELFTWKRWLPLKRFRHKRCPWCREKLREEVALQLAKVKNAPDFSKKALQVLELLEILR